MAGFELTPEEIKLFLEEAWEQLEAMEQGLIALEEDSSDAETIQRVFRAAHTLKGGSATAGFDNVAGLTHVMESLLDLVRKGKTPLTPDLADRLLTSVDAVRRSLEAIEQGRTADGVDLSSEIALVEEGIAAAQDDAPLKPAGDAASIPLEPGTSGVVVTVSPDAAMPTVRAYQALLAIEDFGEIAWTDPPRAVIEKDAQDVRRLAVVFRCDRDMATVQQALLSISDVVAVEPIAGEAPAPTAPAAPAGMGELGQTIRVDVRLLDRLMNLVGELVIDRTRLAQLAGADMDKQALQEELSQISGRLSRVSSDLQDSIMQARMMPVDMLFKRFPRMVRDLSRQLDKPLRFDISGQETELDRSVIERIGDPLMHLLRNAVDHGIEPPDERAALGKPREGRLTLAAYHQENHIYIQVKDDGRGLDLDRLKRKAVESGLLQPDEAERLSDEEAADLIFSPGLSTAKDVSSISGRGVGMDVVKRNIERVSGSLSIATERGRGTVVTIKLPLTLAIVQALMVEIKGGAFAVPLANVTEAAQISREQIRRAKGWDWIDVRETVTPLVNPGMVWGDGWRVDWSGKSRLPAVVLRSDSSPLALMVDRLVGEQEIVIKTIGPIVGAVPGVSGASILGDGRVALIIDPATLSAAVKQAV